MTPAERNRRFWRTLLYDRGASPAANVRDWIVALAILIAVLTLLRTF